MPAPPPTKIVPGLEEVLVATGPVTDGESKDLDAALKEFHDSPAKVGQGGDSNIMVFFSSTRFSVLLSPPCPTLAGES